MHKLKSTLTSLKLLLCCMVVAGLSACNTQSSSANSSFDPLVDGTICTTEKPFVQEELGEPQQRVSVAVRPNGGVPDGSDFPAFRVAKDDVVQVAVKASRAGAVTIHGILDLHQVRVGQEVYVKFRAKYSGRFPLHFHGEDGTHVEIAAFEVLKADVIRGAD